MFSENPCPITFEKPPAVNESNKITLTCSTLSSCPSSPQIEGLTQLSQTHNLFEPQQTDEKLKSTTLTVSFTADWEDDGKEFSCQTRDNKDPHLLRKINLIVECKLMNGQLKSNLLMSCDAVRHKVPIVNPAAETGL